MPSVKVLPWKSCQSEPGCVDLPAPAIVAGIKVYVDDGTCSMDLLRTVAEAYSLGLTRVGAVIAGVAMVARNREATAMRRDALQAEIDRMAGAFEHSDLRDALALSARC